MSTMLRVISAITLFGSAGAMVGLPGLFQQARTNTMVRGFTAVLLVGLLISVIGGLELWRLRRWGRILSTVALSMFMLLSLAILANGGGNGLTVVRLVIELAMIIVLISSGARELCRE
jgi:uncharacterized membrane protein (DUF2068 family)